MLAVVQKPGQWRTEQQVLCCGVCSAAGKARRCTQMRATRADVPIVEDCDHSMQAHDASSAGATAADKPLLHYPTATTGALLLQRCRKAAPGALLLRWYLMIAAAMGRPS